MIRAGMYVQLVRSDNDTYKSKIRTFYECGSKEADYISISLGTQNFYEKDFDVKVMISRSSKYTQNVVSGSVAP